MPLQRNTIYVAGVAAAFVTLIALAIANFVGVEAGEQGGGREFVISAAISLAVAAALFAWYIPRAGRAAGGGLVTSLLALASVAVFWSGLPFVLGAAGAVLGEPAAPATRNAVSRRRLSWSAFLPFFSGPSQ